MSDDKKKPPFGGGDYAAIEARVLAHHLANGGKVGEPYGPTDPVERARWKVRNFLKHYGTTGRMKDR